jgi:ATP-binding cassette subfamily B protein
MISVSLVPYLKKLMRPYRLYMIGLCIIALSAGFFKLATHYGIKQLIDQIPIRSQKGEIIWLIMAIILCKLCHHGVFFFSRLLDMRYKPRLLEETISQLFTHVTQHSLYWFESRLSGDISSKLIDFHQHLSLLVTALFRSLVHITTLMISLVFLWQTSQSAMLVLFAFIIIYLPLLSYLLIYQQQLQQHYTHAKQHTSGLINDALSNIATLKMASSLSIQMDQNLRPSLQNWRFWERRTRHFDAFWVDNTDTLLVTMMVGAQIYLISYLFQHQLISAGSCAFIAMVTLMVHDEVDGLLEKLLFQANPAFSAMRASYEAIFVPYDVIDQPDALSLPRSQGHLAFHQASFTYPNHHEAVLRSVDFTIHPGEHVGIVGPSGAGKSTLIKSVLRYFDLTHGSITLDGYPIQQLTQDSLRSQIAVIPQDISLFHRSIYDNLCINNPEASLETIISACQQAHIHDDIMRMPDGYDSIVGERGVRLSGGQRQRIAIARAILKNAPILILDEATSALDSATEQAIQDSLRSVFTNQNMTVIAIAHRLSTLMQMDRIIVMNNGSIVEQGTHNQLINQEHGLYRHLWHLQHDGFLGSS